MGQRRMENLLWFMTKSENQLIGVKEAVFGHIVPNVAKVGNRGWGIDYRWHGSGVVVEDEMAVAFVEEGIPIKIGDALTLIDLINGRVNVLSEKTQSGLFGGVERGLDLFFEGGQDRGEKGVRVFVSSRLDRPINEGFEVIREMNG